MALTKADMPRIEATAAQHDETGNGVQQLIRTAASEVEGQFDPTSSELAKKTHAAWLDLQEFGKKAQGDLQHMAGAMRGAAAENMQTDVENAAGLPQAN
ncbi:hypothetical protein HX744_26655 [Pseudonocardia sp. ICBG1122]|nr:hypothetical protein [Pseudonocardia pini]